MDAVVVTSRPKETPGKSRQVPASQWFSQISTGLVPDHFSLLNKSKIIPLMSFFLEDLLKTCSESTFYTTMMHVIYIYPLSLT